MIFKLRNLGILLVSAWSAAAAHATTLPPGRAWAPVAPLAHPSVAAFGMPSLVSDSEGRPALVVASLRNGDPTARWSVLAWKDSVWGDSIWSAQPAGFLQSLVMDQGGNLNLLYVSFETDRDGYPRLLLSRLGMDVGPPETIAVTTSQLSRFALSGAITAGRRWVTRIDQPVGQPFQVRTYYSDAPGSWQPVATQGDGDYNCAIAPVSDTSALLVHTGFDGSWWARLEGSQWTPAEPFPALAEGPQFIHSPSGDLWLLSSNRENVHIDRWDGARWTRENDLRALRDPDHGFQHVGYLEPSVQRTGRPAIAWQENWGDTHLRWHSAAHVAWPMVDGWSPGYQVPESDNMGPGPTVTLDRNGDAWIAWYVNDQPNRWTHSYVTATATAPRIVSDGSALRIDWELSESVPASRWAILRAVGDGEFEVVARVGSASGTAMSWTDESPPLTAKLRYRIRRESVDTRYVWESAPTSWVAHSTPSSEMMTDGLRLSAARNPVGADATLELRSAAAGPIDIFVHDLQGRLVSVERVVLGENGAAQVRVALAARPKGVYLVRAHDDRGRMSPVIRLVRLGD